MFETKLNSTALLINERIEQELTQLEYLYFFSNVFKINPSLNQESLLIWIISSRTSAHEWKKLTNKQKNINCHDEQYSEFRSAFFSTKVSCAIKSINVPGYTYANEFVFLEIFGFPKEWYGPKLEAEYNRRNGKKYQSKG